MDKQSLSYYIERYAQGNANPAEKEILAELLSNPANEAELDQVLKDHWAFWEKAAVDFPDAFNRVEQAVAARITHKKSALIPLYQRWWVAAAVLLLFAVGTYLWVDNNKRTSSTEALADVVITPGQDGAILTLSDGRKIVLDSLGNGLIATQNGAQVRIQNGQLTYDANGKTAGETVYNTMSTPNGRQFQLVLPDGSKVWLNAASSITYPTTFAGNERKVTISGEAYFEVVNVANMPFRVNANNLAEIDVLGTHFNISAYNNEKSLNTTLLEGAVRVAVVSDQPKNAASALLRPGQQAQVFAQQGQPEIQVISSADIDKVMAWKNGVFDFAGLSLEEAMRQLERWYDIEVIYENEIPAIHFFGKMSRDVSLQDLIKVLEAAEVRFRIEEGRKLIVM